MRRTVTLALGLVAAVTLVAPTAASADVRPGAQPQVSRIGTARVAAGDTVTVPITYKCKDRPAPAGTTHYLTVNFEQAGADRYQVGERNNNGGLLRATCDGMRRSQVVTLYRTAYGDPALPSAHSGTATVTATLSQHATEDAGGWYVTTGRVSTLSGSVVVR